MQQGLEELYLQNEKSRYVDTNRLFNRKKYNSFWLSRNFDLRKRKPVQFFFKRLFEVTACTLGLIMLSPLMIFVALAIKKESSGPILFKQLRIGEHGKKFQIYKFRSMTTDAEEKFESLKSFNETNEKMFKIKEDPRVTKVGKFIRKYSIDELPQLFNVIKGEMSLVGPRPPLPSEVETYEKHHYLRFCAPPGITGMWQISGRSKIIDFETVVKMDYWYTQKWSLWLDLKLILKTIPVVISAKGAS